MEFSEVRTDSYARSCIARSSTPGRAAAMGFARDLRSGASSKVRPRLLRLASWFVVYKEGGDEDISKPALIVVWV